MEAAQCLPAEKERNFPVLSLDRQAVIPRICHQAVRRRGNALSELRDVPSDRDLRRLLAILPRAQGLLLVLPELCSRLHLRVWFHLDDPLAVHQLQAQVSGPSTPERVFLPIPEHDHR